MVPVVADQVTAVFVVFDTAAVNAKVPPDATVAVAGVTVTATATETVIRNFCEPPELFESVTWIPKLEVPVAEGVPEIIPLLAPRTSPAGNRPHEIAKV
jgi:hypothetical protein